VLTALIALLVAAPPPHCGPLDLDTALLLAGRRSDEVAIRESEQAAAEADRALARAARILPISTATLVFGPSPGARGNVLQANHTNRSLRDVAPFGRIEIDLIQPIYTWGQLGAASDAAEAGVKARTLLVQDTLSQVQLRVVQLFWGEALARKLLAVAADVEKALAEVDKRMAESVASGEGAVNASDRYRVDLFKGQLQVRKADAQRGLEQTRIGLAATLGMAPGELELAQANVLEAPPPPPVDAGAARAEAEHRRPDLLALDQAIAARQAEVRANHGAMLPQIFAAGTFVYAYAPNRDIQLNPWVSDPFNQLAAGAVIGLRQNLAFPLLSAQAKKAEAELGTLERQRSGLMRLVQVQVDTAVSDLAAAQSKQAAARTALTAARSWFRSATLNFGVGVVEARDLLEAYGSYIESQVVLAQSSYEVIVNRARLDQVTGVPPKRGEPQCSPR
jgi:outer membrane protein TolC